MAYEQSPRPVPKAHSMNMENREKLSLSGVEDVSGFDENLVVLRTNMGELNIRGESLHIGRIDLESGSLELSGRIQELSYDERGPRPTLWSRLFG